MGVGRRAGARDVVQIELPEAVNVAEVLVDTTQDGRAGFRRSTRTSCKCRWTARQMIQWPGIRPGADDGDSARHATRAVKDHTNWHAGQPGRMCDSAREGNSVGSGPDPRVGPARAGLTQSTVFALTNSRMPRAELTAVSDRFTPPNGAWIRRDRLDAGDELLLLAGVVGPHTRAGRTSSHWPAVPRRHRSRERSRRRNSSSRPAGESSAHRREPSARRSCPVDRDGRRQ